MLALASSGTVAGAGASDGMAGSGRRGTEGRETDTRRKRTPGESQSSTINSVSDMVVGDETDSDMGLVDTDMVVERRRPLPAASASMGVHVDMTGSVLGGGGKGCDGSTKVECRLALVTRAAVTVGGTSLASSTAAVVAAKNRTDQRQKQGKARPCELE